MNCPGAFKVFYRKAYVNDGHRKAIRCFTNTHFVRNILWDKFRKYKLVFLDSGKIYPGLFKRMNKSISRTYWEF